VRVVWQEPLVSRLRRRHRACNSTRLAIGGTDGGRQVDLEEIEQFGSRTDAGQVAYVRAREDRQEFVRAATHVREEDSGSRKCRAGVCVHGV
jgi:hypothetical protein